MVGFRNLDYFVLTMYMLFTAILFLSPALFRSPMSLEAMLVMYLIMTAIAICWAVLNRRDRIEQAMPKTSIGQTLLLIIAYFLGSLFLQMAIAIMLIYGFGIDVKQFSNADEIRSIIEKNIWFIAVVVISAPIVEEVIFRGILFRRFVTLGYFWLGFLLNSVLFAALHMILPAFVTFLVLGFLLTDLYHRTKRFWAPVALHFMINSMSLSAQFLTNQS